MEITEYFRIQNLISAFLWLVLVVLFSGLKRARNKNIAVYSNFLPQVYFHVLMALFFGVFYLLYYGGGDTTAYWDGAVALHNLFFVSPSAFFSEIWNTPDIFLITKNFNQNTGYPPSWIYKEPESYFISKILSVLSMITFRSYIASTILLGYFSSLITWKFFLAIRSLEIHDTKLLSIGILFFPSVAFWCSGISKDTFVYFAVLIFVRQLILLSQAEEKNYFSSFLFVFLALFCITKTRMYVLIALLPSFFVGLSIWLTNKAKTNRIKKFSTQLFFYSLGIGVIFIFIQFKTLDKIIEEIVIIQKDFSGNSTYAGKQYDLNISDYSTLGIVKSVPAAIIASLYRPFPWEALDPILLLNGVENLFLFYLSYLFIAKDFRKRIRKINQSPILTFSFIFLFIMGFSIGFSSGLFGVLVRFKTILIPFFVILLTVKANEKATTSLP